jgi:hypothetical protein
VIGDAVYRVFNKITMVAGPVRGAGLSQVTKPPALICAVTLGNIERRISDQKLEDK